MSESPKGMPSDEVRELPRMPARSRFGYYFVGLSIGCVMSWAIVSARSKAVARQQARDAAATAERDASAARDDGRETATPVETPESDD